MASAPELNLWVHSLKWCVWINALLLRSIALGSNYGFALIDALQNKLIMVHSTFDASKLLSFYHSYINFVFRFARGQLSSTAINTKVIPSVDEKI